MRASAIACVRHLVEEYRSFLETSYRCLDPRLREQFYPEERIAIFCEGFAYHGNPNTLELDSKKRNWLRGEGWIVLTYWGRAIRRNPELCAKEIAALFEARRRFKIA